jgi:membrane protease YdiL (CAAX protease family)
MLNLAILSVLLVPVLFQAVPNPVAVCWVAKHGSRPMPPELERKAVAVSTAIPFLEVIVLGAISWALLTRLEAGDRSLEAGNGQWIRYGALGLVAGGAWLSFYNYLIGRFRLTKNQLRGHRFVQQPVPLSMALGIGAAIVEEIWRAACLTGLARWGTTAAVAITSLVFGLAHAQRLGRVVSTTLFGVYLAMLYLNTQSLLPSIAAHVTVNLGTMLLVRSAYHRAPDEPALYTHK